MVLQGAGQQTESSSVQIDPDMYTLQYQSMCNTQEGGGVSNSISMQTFGIRKIKVTLFLIFSECQSSNLYAMLCFTTLETAKALGS